MSDELDPQRPDPDRDDLNRSDSERSEPKSPFGEPRKAAPANGGDMAQRKRAALIAMVGVAFLLGAVDTWLFGAPGPLQGGRLLVAVIGNVSLLFIGFHWLHLDAIALQIRRPAWLNIGIILVAIGFVPYYLFKTRPDGQRGIAIAGFFGMVVAISLAMSFGSTMVAALSGDSSSATTTPI